MSKVFLIHGIGVHAEDWAAKLVEQLTESWKSFDSLGAKPIPDFISINYDTLFDRYRGRIAEAANDLGGFDDGGKLLGVMRQALGKAGGDNFFATHIQDLLLFLNPLFKQQILTDVWQQIAAHQPGANEVFRFSVIAHSLGTAVIQQTLQAQARLEKDNLGSPMFRVGALMMIANVSSLLERKDAPHIYDSFVRPSRDTSGVVDIYLNARNKLDPVCKPKEFVASGTDWINAKDDKRFLDIPVSFLKESLNPHSLEDYLGHPEIVVPLFRAIVSGKTPTNVELQKKLGSYQSYAQVPGLNGKVAEYVNVAAGPTVASLLGILAQIAVLSHH